ncbi:MAG: class I SAM-dependent methyltransferase [Chitinophagaceae bacterium]
MSKKISWLGTWLSFKILKRVLVYRITGKQNEFWIQTPKKNKVNIFNRIDFILDYCKNKNVLHIGCTDYPFTEKKLGIGSLLNPLLKQVSANVMGIDNNKDSIEEYTKLTGDKEVYYCDIIQSYPVEISSNSFDIILLSEVLEHLINPAKALNVLHAHFTNGTQILVTVPNYAAIDGMAASLNKKEAIHPDHYWYFSPYTLCKLFDKDKFELHQLNFGMYYQRNTKLNMVMKSFPFNGDCIIAVLSIKK